MPNEQLVFTVVGDRSVGKTYLLSSLTCNGSPISSLPRVLAPVSVGAEQRSRNGLVMYDTDGFLGDIDLLALESQLHHTDSSSLPPLSLRSQTTGSALPATALSPLLAANVVIVVVPPGPAAIDRLYAHWLPLLSLLGLHIPVIVASRDPQPHTALMRLAPRPHDQGADTTSHIEAVYQWALPGDPAYSLASSLAAARSLFAHAERAAAFPRAACFATTPPTSIALSSPAALTQPPSAASPAPRPPHSASAPRDSAPATPLSAATPLSPALRIQPPALSLSSLSLSSPAPHTRPLPRRSPREQDAAPSVVPARCAAFSAPVVGAIRRLFSLFDPRASGLLSEPAFGLLLRVLTPRHAAAPLLPPFRRVVRALAHADAEAAVSAPATNPVLPLVHRGCVTLAGLTRILYDAALAPAPVVPLPSAAPLAPQVDGTQLLRALLAAAGYAARIDGDGDTLSAPTDGARAPALVVSASSTASGPPGWLGDGAPPRGPLEEPDAEELVPLLPAPSPATPALALAWPPSAAAPRPCQCPSCRVSAALPDRLTAPSAHAPAPADKTDASPAAPSLSLPAFAFLSGLFHSHAHRDPASGQPRLSAVPAETPTATALSLALAALPPDAQRQWLRDPALGPLFHAPAPAAVDAFVARHRSDPASAAALDILRMSPLRHLLLPIPPATAALLFPSPLPASLSFPAFLAAVQDFASKHPNMLTTTLFLLGFSPLPHPAPSPPPSPPIRPLSLAIAPAPPPPLSTLSAAGQRLRRPLASAASHAILLDAASGAHAAYDKARAHADRALVDATDPVLASTIRQCPASATPATATALQPLAALLAAVPRLPDIAASATEIPPPPPVNAPVPGLRARGGVWSSPAPSRHVRALVLGAPGSGKASLVRLLRRSVHPLSEELAPAPLTGLPAPLADDHASGYTLSATAPVPPMPAVSLALALADPSADSPTLSITPRFPALEATAPADATVARGALTVSSEALPLPPPAHTPAAHPSTAALIARELPAVLARSRSRSRPSPLLPPAPASILAAISSSSARLRLHLAPSFLSLHSVHGHADAQTGAVETLHEAPTSPYDLVVVLYNPTSADSVLFAARLLAALPAAAPRVLVQTHTDLLPASAPPLPRLPPCPPHDSPLYREHVAALLPRLAADTPPAMVAAALFPGPTAMLPLALPRVVPAALAFDDDQPAASAFCMSLPLANLLTSRLSAPIDDPMLFARLHAAATLPLFYRALPPQQPSWFRSLVAGGLVAVAVAIITARYRLTASRTTADS